MKTEAVCLAKMGKETIELVEIFPQNSLPKEQLNFIQKNSMPIGAKNGDYFTIRIDNSGKILFSYVFVLPPTVENERNIIASLIAVAREHEKILVDKIHEEYETQKEFVRISFSKIINNLHESALLSLPNIIQIIPAIFDGMLSGHFTLSINGRKAFEFGFGNKIRNEEEITRETMMNELF